MSKLVELARKMRAAMDAAGAMLTDEQASTVSLLYKPWRATDDNGNAMEYTVGERRTYNGGLYRCLIAHTAQAGWEPDISPSLWAKVLIPDPDVIPEWEQPDSTNPYMKGDKVTHNGKTWVSDVDNNVWEPGVYGWSEVSA